MICIFHSLNYDINFNLLQRKIYIHILMIKNSSTTELYMYTKVLEKQLAQDN